MTYYPLVQKCLYVVGVMLLISATCLAAANLLGWISLSGMLPGESAIHTIARVAVIGCMLAALGSINK